MLNQDLHPDAERLSALAASDPDATDDASLVAHVSGCTECAAVVSDLSALRTALADLPDIAPPRPLMLLPGVSEVPLAPADRFGQWARRIFAPAMTAGAVLAMVGVLGTALPTVSGGAGAGAAASAERADLEVASEATASAAAAAPSEGAGAENSYDGGGAGSAAAEASDGAITGLEEDSGTTRQQVGDEGAGAQPERSPWPMVLFTGVAVMVGAALLRWILVPQAAR
jgi:hypothetical protein